MNTRGGQQMRLDAAALQSTVTWGGRQQTDAFTAPAPGATFLFPVAPVPPLINRFPGVTALDQLVEARYQRPTTWSINLYSFMPTPMPAGDSFEVTWTVRASVGRATIDLSFFQAYPGSLTITSQLAQSVLTSFQLAAHAIQITPAQIRYDFAGSGTQQGLQWAAWVAPLVD